MTVAWARVVLVAIFLIGLAVQLVAVMVAYSKNFIAYGDLTNLLTKLLAVYSVHLAVIFGGIFAQQQNDQQVLVTATPFRLAVALAVGWNLLLMWRSVMFGMAAFDPEKDDNVDRLSSYIENIASASSFLVTGALAFFFAKK